MVQVGGIGNRTNNLFDLKKSVSKKYINSNGNEATSLSPTPENTLNHSDYVSIESNVNYTFTCTTSQNYSLENTIALCWFDENKNILSRNTMNIRGNINNYSITALSPSTAKYLIVNFIAYVDDAVFYLNEGTTTVFEPYGYKVPVVCGGTTTNIYLDEPIGANESISLSDTNVNIPTIRGTNVLTVDTTVQPSNVYIKSRHESSYEAAMRERYEEAQAQLDALESEEE